MIRALTLSLAVLAALAFTEACGAPRCTTTNCKGCCDTEGVCRTGDAQDACGASGVSCARCPGGPIGGGGAGYFCENRSCVPH